MDLAIFFVSAFAGSTILPISSEVVLGALALAGATGLAAPRRSDRGQHPRGSGQLGPRDRPKSGRPSWRDDGQLATLRALVLRGPDPERDGVSTWRAKDLCRIVEDRFGVSYTDNGMLRLLHDLGLSWQKARPIHPEADRKAQERGKKIPRTDHRACPRSPETERLAVWFLDEARVGQTGRVCRRWFERGVPRETALRRLLRVAVACLILAGLVPGL